MESQTSHHAGEWLDWHGKIFKLDNDIIISKVIFTKRVLIWPFSQKKHVSDWNSNGFLEKLWCFIGGSVKQKLGFIKRVDKGWIDTGKYLVSWRLKR